MLKKCMYLIFTFLLGVQIAVVALKLFMICTWCCVCKFTRVCVGRYVCKEGLLRSEIQKVSEDRGFLMCPERSFYFSGGAK